MQRIAQRSNISKEAAILDESLTGFTDTSSVGSYAVQPMNRAVKRCIISVYNDKTCKLKVQQAGPKQCSTNAETLYGRHLITMDDPLLVT